MDLLTAYCSRTTIKSSTDNQIFMNVERQSMISDKGSFRYNSFFEVVTSILSNTKSFDSTDRWPDWSVCLNMYNFQSFSVCPAFFYLSFFLFLQSVLLNMCFQDIQLSTLESWIIGGVGIIEGGGLDINNI